MQYFIETYGCQMNVADSELVAGLLNGAGHQPTARIDEAGIILLNTCSVREKAEETVLNRLSQLAALKKRDPGTLIGVLGCTAKNLAESLLESMPFVDLVLGPDSYRRLPQIINERQTSNVHPVDTKLSRIELYEDLYPSRAASVNAWISIMRGCNKFCTFCVVPFTRGRERSRALAGIVEEARSAVGQGFQEITLLGQNVNSYRSGTDGFAQLLAAVAAVPGVRRLRFISPHPSDMGEDVLAVMAAHYNICKSIHLPLQAGADRVLRRMNRTYTKQEYLQLAARIREVLPGCTLSTDIIVGFPGETEAEFGETLEVMRQVQFDSAFTFKYSPRPGTKATEYHDPVNDAVKQARLDRLITLQKPISLRRNQQLIGSTVEVLIEKESKKSPQQWAGRTDSNKWVVFDKEWSQPGEFVNVHVDGSFGIALQGHLNSDLEALNAVA
ncbi:MAG: tRNA (N6-isopentenyl adenosine(37)-C2)-methylthiotransferase MiaB [Candidatus Marinimicrobia bacterium]|nr:tRNA (N6-isopentenyl adenosine(37)-C2)-methylthiotransferase MiaB [Candidatus Neomarinimicrobiota bacterium]